MSNNFWEESGNPDNPIQFEGGEWKETADPMYQEAPAPLAKAVNNNVLQSSRNKAEPQIEEDFVEQYVEDMESQEEDEDEDFANVLVDARLRLEQGKLFEMIMNHNLFDGVDADPRATKIVQKLIRKWAKEQMEIMLGMRKETSKIETLHIDFPFNSMEVTILKKLASAASKGATENSDSYVPEVRRVTEEVPVVPKKKSLNSISAAPKHNPQPKPVAKSEPIKSRPEPLKRESKPQPKPETNEKGMLTSKALHEMTEEEKEQKIRENIERNRGKKAYNPEALPQPTFEQREALAMSQVHKAMGSKNLSSAIVAALNKKAGQ